MNSQLEDDQHNRKSEATPNNFHTVDGQSVIALPVDMPAGRPERMKELLNSPAFHCQLAASEVIFGVNETNGVKFVAFGRKLLSEIASGKFGANREADVYEVPILQETEELEALLVAVRKVKGYDDYQSSNYGKPELVKTEPVGRATGNPRSVHDPIFMKRRGKA